MKEVNLIENNILTLITSVACVTLAREIFGKLTINDYKTILEIMDKFSAHDVLYDPSDDAIVKMVPEVLHAWMAEIVQEFDDKTVNNILKRAHPKTIILENGGFFGERLAPIGTAIDEFKEKYKDKDGEMFIISSPMFISILQACIKNIFAPALQGEFKGPNNTMLVGTTDGIPVYSYIFNPSCKLDAILGFRDYETNRMDITPLVIENLTFA